ncbi:MAG: DUF444 family protein [Parcubacteria group bacterium]|nr:DUF444 family protein [Parcubacteria group bacterium]
MPIIVSEHIQERGKGDARRHRDKQREAIKKNLPEILSEESIITGRPGKIIKVPIKSLDIPHFKHGRGKDENDAGVGQGKGKPGDVIGRRPGKGTKPGGPGTEPGVDYLEAEFTIEELTELFLEDMGLPRLEKKNVREIEVELGFKVRGTQRTGPHVLLNRKKNSARGNEAVLELSPST